VFEKTPCGLKLSLIILATFFSFSVHAWDGDQIDNDEKSGSPWQLYPMLDKFLSADSFPAGSFNMKEFRANPSSAQFWEFISSGSTEEFKKQVIKDIITSYPHRQFILIGDSGEHDPEVYGWAAAVYPDQTSEIYIRNVTREAFGNKRMQDSFGSLMKKVRLIDMNDGSIQKP
jgi:phosphatidate phosphatase APP1